MSTIQHRTTDIGAQPSRCPENHPTTAERCIRERDHRGNQHWSSYPASEDNAWPVSYGSGRRRQTKGARVVFVPISVAWAFTAVKGWHVIEDPTSAIDMDRLCELADEAEARAIGKALPIEAEARELVTR